MVNPAPHTKFRTLPDQGVFLGVAERIKRRQRSHARLDSYSPRLRQSPPAK